MNNGCDTGHNTGHCFVHISGLGGWMEFLRLDVPPSVIHSAFSNTDSEQHDSCHTEKPS